VVRRSAKAIVLLAVWTALATLAARNPEWVAAAFSRPAGWVAASYFAAPAAPEGHALVFSLPDGPVTVSTACAGVQFFLLLVVLVAWRLPRRLLLRGLLCALPLAYALTLGVNTVRIILSVTVQQFTLAALWPGLAPAAHLAAGVAVFLPSLIAAYAGLERTLRHVD